VPGPRRRAKRAVGRVRRRFVLPGPYFQSGRSAPDGWAFSSDRHSSCYAHARAPGDVAVLEVVEGPVSFVDTRNNRRDGKVYLKPVRTVAAGVAFGRPYQAPFAVR
jgi:hypothetical protein